MEQEPSVWELLLLFVVIGGSVTLAGGAVVLSVVGLTVWGRHLLRKRREAASTSGEPPTSLKGDS
ncbi:hypothetical protein [Streptomyces sp. NPDC002855]|uniref:hypothetical protein n=1 Tax=unclassified Streptomyces TaxID=2593676 RepID=UPI003331DBC6